MSIKIGIGIKQTITGSPTPPPITPYDLAYPIIADGNTFAWYIADDLTTITKDGGNNVSQWNDKLGSGNNLLQADPLQKPVWSLADGITYPGTAEMLTGAFAKVQPIFYYFVMKQITWNNSCVFVGGIGLNTQFKTHNVASPQVVAYNGGTSLPSSDLTLGVWHIVRLLFNGANSKLIIDNNAPIVGNFGANNLTGIIMGDYVADWGMYTNFSIKEGLFRTSLDAVGESLIYNYYKWKYSL